MGILPMLKVEVRVCKRDVREILQKISWRGSFLVILPERGGHYCYPTKIRFFPNFFFLFSLFFSFFCCFQFKISFLISICNDIFSYFIPLDSLRLMNSKFIFIIEPHYCHLYVKKMLKSLIKMNKIK